MLSVREALERLRADFVVNPSPLPRVTLVVWRIGQAGHGRPGAGGFLLRRVHDALNHVWVRGFIGAELPRSVPAGPGLRIPHEARGVILSPFSEIGAGVTIYHQVTLGVRGGPTNAPHLADGAYVGAGAKLIGPVTVGRASSVGANAVVTHDVPDGEVWVGVPARPVQRGGAPAADGSVDLPSVPQATSEGSST